MLSYNLPSTDTFIAAWVERQLVQCLVNNNEGERPET